MKSPTLAAAIESNELIPLTRYALEAQVGAGEWGEVFLGAIEGAAGLRRPVAVKLLDAPFAAAVPGLARAALLTHPGVVAVLDAGLFDGQPAVVTDYVRGVSLRALLVKLNTKGMRLPLASAVRIAALIAGALAHAHEQQGGALVHGRVHPGHVLCGFDGMVRLAGFGGAPSKKKGSPERSYFAPEVRRGGGPSVAGDVYGVGALLYELATGRTVWKAATTSVTSLAEPIPKPSRMNPGVDGGLETAILSALESDPNRRPPTARAFQSLLEACLGEAGTLPTPRELAGIVADAFPEGPPLARLPEPRRPQPPEAPPLRAERPTEIARVEDILPPHELEPEESELATDSGLAAEATQPKVPEPTVLSALAQEATVIKARPGRHPAPSSEAATDEALAPLPAPHQTGLSRRALLALGGCAALIVAVTARAFFGAPAPAKLTVVSEPLGIEVTVDGKAAGRTPLDLDGLAPGAHAVVGSRDGYQAHTERVTLGAGEHQSLSMALRPVDPPAPRSDPLPLPPPEPAPAPPPVARAERAPPRSRPAHAPKRTRPKRHHGADARSLLGAVQRPSWLR